MPPVCFSMYVAFSPPICKSMPHKKKAIPAVDLININGVSIVVFIPPPAMNAIATGTLVCIFVVISVGVKEAYRRPANDPQERGSTACDS